MGSNTHNHTCNSSVTTEPLNQVCINFQGWQTSWLQTIWPYVYKRLMMTLKPQFLLRLYGGYLCLSLTKLVDRAGGWCLCSFAVYQWTGRLYFHLLEALVVRHLPNFKQRTHWFLAVSVLEIFLKGYFLACLNFCCVFSLFYFSVRVSVSYILLCVTKLNIKNSEKYSYFLVIQMCCLLVQVPLY